MRAAASQKWKQRAVASSAKMLPAGVGCRFVLAGHHQRQDALGARLLKFPPFIDAVQNNPKFGLKYLTEHYLV
jgi:hypothetical protein